MRVAVAHLALSLVFVVSSCRKEDAPNVVRFVTSMSPGEPELVRTVLGEFSKAHPEWDVKYEPISGTYMTLIQTRIAAGSPPRSLHPRGR